MIASALTDAAILIFAAQIGFGALLLMVSSRARAGLSALRITGPGKTAFSLETVQEAVKKEIAPVTEEVMAINAAVNNAAQGELPLRRLVVELHEGQHAQDEVIQRLTESLAGLHGRLDGFLTTAQITTAYAEINQRLDRIENEITGEHRAQSE